VELDVAEDLRGRLEAQRGAAALARRARDLQRIQRLAEGVFLLVVLAVAPDVEPQVLAQRVDHRDAHAVQAAGNLVAVVVELAARVQHREDDLGRRDVFFLVDVDRDAATVVGHRHRTVLVDGDGDVVGMAGQGLVDRVVDHLEHHVVQAGAVMDVADVHAGTLADGLEAAQDGDLAGVVAGVGGLGGAAGVFGHLGASGRWESPSNGRRGRAGAGHITYRGLKRALYQFAVHGKGWLRGRSLRPPR